MYYSGGVIVVRSRTIWGNIVYHTLAYFCMGMASEFKMASLEKFITGIFFWGAIRKSQNEILLGNYISEDCRPLDITEIMKLQGFQMFHSMFRFWLR